MAAFSIILAVFLLLGQGSASIQDHCTDISYWDEIRYETTTKQCCDTKLHQVCTTKRDQICQDVLELQCEVVAWGECQSTPTSTRSTKCDVKYNDFAHQNCEEVTTSVAHTKKVPECKEITKNNCVTDWDHDSNGNKVWAGTETCTPVTWEDCDIVEKTVEFPTVKTECGVDSHIKWAELVDVTTNIVGLESKCEVKKAVNCKHVVANKCAPVVWQECKMEPREKCLAVVIHTPIQEKIHQKKCLTGDNTDHFNQPRPRNQLVQNDSFPSDLATLLKPTRGQVSTATEMHNIGKLFSGYDIMKGNPIPVDPFPVDPGFRQPIFKASYLSGSMTGDRRYLQPDGTTISSCIGACSLSFGTTEISGSKSYQESLARKVGLSVGGSIGAWGGKFSASYGYKEVAEKTSSESTLFTLSSASCCAYSAEILSFNLPSLSQNFRDGVETLTEKYDERIYLNFIEAFGTHFIRKALMGALYGEQTEISKEAWTTLQENGIDISTAAELSAYGIEGSASFESSEDEKKAAEFSKKAEDQKTFTIGVKPPADGQKGTWLQKSIEDPAPIELTLGGSLLYLFDHDDIKSNVSTAVKANMKKALDDYCGLLLKSGEAKTCSSPGADPAFPINIAVLKPTVESSKDFKMYSGSYKGALLLENACEGLNPSNYWLTPGGKTGEEASIILNLGRVVQFNRLKIKNTHNGQSNDRGAKDIGLYTSNSKNGPWKLVAEKLLADARNKGCNVPVEEVTIKTTDAQFIKLVINSYYGYGGGLQYLGVFRVSGVPEIVPEFICPSGIKFTSKNVRVAERLKQSCTACWERADGCSAPYFNEEVEGYFEGYFRTSCDIHDLCYGYLGRSKDDCDKEFKENMLKECGSDNTFCRILAEGAYQVVRVHEKATFVYNSGQEAAKTCILR